MTHPSIGPFDQFWFTIISTGLGAALMLAGGSRIGLGERAFGIGLCVGGALLMLAGLATALHTPHRLGLLIAAA
jgi:hypothetical protein